MKPHSPHQQLLAEMIREGTVGDAPNDICLQISNGRWCWDIIDSDMDPITFGSSGDYSTACADALAAWDQARKVTA